MSWNIFEESPRSKFTEPFSSKYTLYIDADIMAGSIAMKSKTEIRWQVEVKNISEDFADIHITTLHHRILESNNPMLTDIAGVSSTFGNMYSELELTVNEKGNIVKIKNLDTIQKKWQWTKQDMEKLIHENEALQDIILLNDELYSSPEMIKKSIEANEFFSIYFHLFWGKGLPGTLNRIEKNNLLNTHTLRWAYNGNRNRDYNPKGTKPMQLSITGYHETTINKDWLKQAYGAFEHLPLQGMKPVFEDKADYSIMPSGKILKAVVEKSEVMHPQLLFVKYRYELTADEEPKQENKTPVQAPTEKPFARKPQSGFNSIIDD